jgi:3-methyladenine DNA glycosylase AlkC
LSKHPSKRFVAPTTIQAGVPLKEIVGKDLIALIGESFAEVVSGFNRAHFVKSAIRGLEPLGLVDRAKHVASALAEQLPSDFDEAAPLLVASLGPELPETEGNGLAPFFYLPHVHYVAASCGNHFKSGMLANYELTKRFTAEYSIRPLLVTHRDRCLKRLARWARDRNPHVRRLVSEGTRPLLPWAMRLKEFQNQPQLALPLLEQLKDDRELYVRRSVANHLGDILKHHPDMVYEVCRGWLEELKNDRPSDEQVANRHWMIRHAVRLPAKKGDQRALKLRLAAAIRRPIGPRV